jgi:hypothetical protein
VRCEGCRKIKKQQTMGAGGGQGGGYGDRSGAAFGGGAFGSSRPRGGMGGGSSGACYSCGQEGHRSFECPTKQGESPSASAPAAPRTRGARPLRAPWARRWPSSHRRSLRARVRVFSR